jgi:tetratricopeptide (TPR) repeat protein
MSLELALEHHRSGRLDEAEKAYREVLATDAQNVDALHFLGVLAFQRNDYPRAHELIARALSHNAANAAAHNNLGNVLNAQGKAMRRCAPMSRRWRSIPSTPTPCAPGRPVRAARQPRQGRRPLPPGAGARGRARQPRAPCCATRRRGRGNYSPRKGRAQSADADTHIGLGRRLKARGALDKSLAHFEQALALAPESADAALYHVGNAAHGRGPLGRSAIACYRKALGLKPDFADALSNLGIALHCCARLDEAFDLLPAGLGASSPALRTRTSTWETRITSAASSSRRARCYGQGAAAGAGLRRRLRQSRQRDPAAGSAAGRGGAVPHRARARARHERDALTTSARRRTARGCSPRPRPALTKYVALAPGNTAALSMLSDTHRNLNELDAARALLRGRAGARSGRGGGAITAWPMCCATRHNTKARSRHYERAIRNDPRPLVAFQNLLFCMMCMGSYSARDVYQKHREFAQRFERPLLSLQRAHRNAPDPDRRLRLGYVSPDFRTNVVAHYVEPILRNHDRENFRGALLFHRRDPDDLTSRVFLGRRPLARRACAFGRRNRAVDPLARHRRAGRSVRARPGNRILVFARKPAPVQVNYLDYSATTGLESIDYRLTTEYCAPGRAAPTHTIPRSCTACRAPSGPTTLRCACPSHRLPMKANGYVTFAASTCTTGSRARCWRCGHGCCSGSPARALLIVGVAQGSTQKALFAAFDRPGCAKRAHPGALTWCRTKSTTSSMRSADHPRSRPSRTTARLTLLRLRVERPARDREAGRGHLLLNAWDAACWSSWGSRADRLGCRRTTSASPPAWPATPPSWKRLRAGLRQRFEQSAMRDFRGFTRSLESAYRAMWKQVVRRQRGCAFQLAAQAFQQLDLAFAVGCASAPAQCSRAAM